VIHEPENSKLHQKVLVDCVQRLSPIMCRVVEEGIGQGIFNTHFPKQCVEILLTSAIILFDDAYFQWEPDEMAAKIPAFLNAMERILGAGEGSLSEFTNAFG
ncbi:MAG: TetR/AcrR family transcriptional regulator, partial [Treponema sp.]|nr:TetR/AcrR family transcriptional regulator [Treponema sp.]